MQTQARVETPVGTSLMKKLCRHFAHKVPAEWSEDEGTITFPFGVCRINAAEDSMDFLITAEDDSAMVKTQKVMTDHLLRMARDETMSVNWVEH